MDFSLVLLEMKYMGFLYRLFRIWGWKWKFSFLNECYCNYHVECDKSGSSRLFSLELSIWGFFKSLIPNLMLKVHNRKLWNWNSFVLMSNAHAPHTEKRGSQKYITDYPRVNWPCAVQWKTGFSQVQSRTTPALSGRMLCLYV